MSNEPSNQVVPQWVKLLYKKMIEMEVFHETR